MNKLNQIILSTMPLGGSTEGLDQLASTIKIALTSVISVLYGVGMLILAYRLISSIIFSKNADNPEEDVAMYKKRIKNAIIAMIIITVVEVGFVSIFQTVLEPWIKSLFGK